MFLGTQIGQESSQQYVLACHDLVGAMALIKIITKIKIHSEIVISLATVYVVFAILFGYVFRANPFRSEKKELKLLPTNPKLH